MKDNSSILSGRWHISSLKGFVSIYVIMVLAVSILLTESVYTEVSRYYDFRSDTDAFRMMNWMEVLTVNRIKQKMRDYKEKNEQYSLNGCSVEIRYDGSTAYITIRYNGHIRYRTLEFDDVDECVRAYY